MLLLDTNPSRHGYVPTGLDTMGHIASAWGHPGNTHPSGISPAFTD